MECDLKRGMVWATSGKIIQTVIWENTDGVGMEHDRLVRKLLQQYWWGMMVDWTVKDCKQMQNSGFILKVEPMYILIGWYKLSELNN